MSTLLKFIISAILVFTSLSAFCTICTWNGSAGDHEWDTASNWDNGVPPTFADTVLINSDSVTINSVSYAKIVEMHDASLLIKNYLAIGAGATGLFCVKSTIYNEGVLEVNSSLSHGIYLTDSSFVNNYNSSTIAILHSGTNSIRIGSDCKIRNQTGGTITNSFCSQGILNQGEIDNRGIVAIIDCTGEAIENTGKITNQGNINIDGTGGDAIYISDSLINETNGEISITNTSMLSGHYSLDLTSTSILLNYGKIDISYAPGINNAGIINNSNKIRLNNIAGFGIINAKTFNNYQNSSILIDNSSTGITTHHTFINEGMIDINHSLIGVVNGAFFYNVDSLIIKNSDHSGIYNQDVFDIHQDGYIQIDTAGSTLTPALDNFDGTLNNFGKILISNSQGDGLLNSSILNNYDSLVIDGTKINSYGLVNLDSISNQANGNILISNCFHGLSNSDGNISNYGSLKLHSTNSHGLINNASFQNYDSLILTDIGVWGILNSDTLQNFNNSYLEVYIAMAGGVENINTHSYILNQGDFNLKSIDIIVFRNYGSVRNEANMLLFGIGPDFNNPDGLNCKEDAIFTNTASGNLSILNIINPGIPLDIELGTQFICDGELDVQID